MRTENIWIKLLVVLYNAIVVAAIVHILSKVSTWIGADATRRNLRDTNNQLFPTDTIGTANNILLIMSDDLFQRSIPPYVDSNHPLGKNDFAPRFHEFIASSTIFNGISVFPVCGPSRASLLTGRLPDNLNIWSFERYIPQAAPGIETFFEYFKDRNYKTAVIGKIFHADNQNGQSLSYLTDQLSERPMSTQKGNNECQSRRMSCSINLARSADQDVLNKATGFLNRVSKNPQQP